MKKKGCILMDDKTNFYIVGKDDVVSAIENSEKELRLLGTTAIELAWQANQSSLYKSLYKKYTKGNYELSVIAESDPVLYSNALISGLDNETSGIPIATLLEARQNSTVKLRDFFISKDKEITGLEPVEDRYRGELDALYNEKFIVNVCKELENRGYELDNQFGSIQDEEIGSNGILKRIVNFCVEKACASFENSEIFSYYLTERKYYLMSRVSSQYEKEILNYLNQKMGKVQNEVNQIKSLFKVISQGIEYDFRDAESKKECKFSISYKELQGICLNSILDFLEENEPRDFKLIREFASKEAYAERNELLRKYNSDSATKQRFSVKQIFHPIPIQMLKVDDVYYASISPLNSFAANEFLYVGNSALNAEEDINRFARYDEYIKYFNVYANSNYCTEETSKGNRKEIIYNYTFNRAIIGQMPRDSFYGSDNYKLVMWALVFDRKGQILIHRRSLNAKDNQGMWDKSVGGHIAINDRDYITGASREIAEELYTIEEEEQGHTKGTGWMSTNKDKIIYLGKWNETRYPNFASNLHLESDEFYSFSFESRMTDQPIDSMRVLPNGTYIKAKCFADLYFVITSETFNLYELKNSKYLVMKPDMIKECAKAGRISEEIVQRIKKENPHMDILPGRFEVTPDLEYMINSPEWDNEITKFSIRVKEAFINGEK